MATHHVVRTTHNANRPAGSEYAAWCSCAVLKYGPTCLDALDALVGHIQARRAEEAFASRAASA